jgi:TatD DNase family protein
MTPIADSHCHLPILAADPSGMSAAEAIAAARAAGVRYLLNVCVELEDVTTLLGLSRAYSNLWCTVGVHPNARSVEEPTVERLVDLAADPKVIAIGETGLDFYRNSGDLDWQYERFRNHIRAARVCAKPLVIHSREARGAVLEVLREDGPLAARGVFHCFVDDWEIARQVLDLGFYISFSGIVTFKNARQVQDVARRVPLDRLLIETDAPYLAPAPYRGRVNQPAWVRFVADCIAEVRAMPLQDVAVASRENFFRLFAVAESDAAGAVAGEPRGPQGASSEQSGCAPERARN